MKQKIVNKVCGLFCLLLFVSAGAGYAMPFDNYTTQYPHLTTPMRSVNFDRLPMKVEADKNAVQLPAIAISRENQVKNEMAPFANGTSNSGPRRVAPGGGGSGTGVVPNPIGDTPWILTLIMLLAYVLKKRLFRKA